MARHREQAMAVKRAVIAAIVGQFGHPQGTAGSVAGWVMAHRPSNRQRNSWVVSLLDVQPTDRVLEIGFGPGLAIAELSRRVGGSGHVYGIDHSEVMLRQATRRNASAIAAGRVSLSRASVDQLPPSLGGPFDAILTVNSLGFWPAPTERLDELRRRWCAKNAEGGSGVEDGSSDAVLHWGWRWALRDRPCRGRSQTTASCVGE
jgi:SAM-dependent methyltransferase